MGHAITPISTFYHSSESSNRARVETHHSADTSSSYQNVKGYSAIVSAALLLPLVVTQSISSTCAGLAMTHFNRYGIIIWTGFSIWLVGSGLLVLANRSLHPGLISLFLIFIGLGTGNVFQPTLVALVSKINDLKPQ